MDTNKIMVCINRQLDAENRMLDELEKICNCFTANALQTITNHSATPRIQFLQSLLSNFKSLASQTVQLRAELLELIQTNTNNSKPQSIRQFIQNGNEPWRSELERKRLGIIDRMYELKVQLAGDSAAVFYSYDFYRRIVNGLIGNSSGETEYCNDGKPIDQSTGAVYEKAC